MSARSHPAINGSATVLVTDVAGWAKLLLIVCPIALLGMSIALYVWRDLIA
jgi:hypothetical protein